MVYDSIVIGAGVMGSSIALRLAQAGQRVVVLERSVPGAEASAAAGGILGPQIEGGAADPLFSLSLASREAYPALAEELRELGGVDIGFRRCGLLQVALAADDPAPLEARYAWQREAGLAIERLSGAEARALEPSLADWIALALHFPEEGQVDPLALAKALVVAASRAGATFRRGKVTKIATVDGRATGVELDGEALHAGAVVLAAGAWTSCVPGVPLAQDVIEPVRGQMVKLSLAEAALGQVVFTPRGYLIPREGGSLVAGSTMERMGFDKRVTVAGLAKILSQSMEAIPALAKATVVDHWSGLRPAPKDGLPLIGSTSTRGLYVASGHHRNGILLTPKTAELLARAVVEGTDPVELRPFAPTRFDRGGVSPALR